MKFLKGLLLFLLAIIGIALLAAAFLKKDYAVERSVVINKPRTEVFDYIKYLKHQDNYSKWATSDPAMKKTYTGTDAQPGFISAWESDVDSVGKGEQEILQITPNERVDYELRFMEPFESKENAYMTTEDAASGSTKVSWGFNGRMTWPMNLMLAFMDMEGIIGNDLQTGLNKLKTVLETMPVTTPVADSIPL